MLENQSLTDVVFRHCLGCALDLMLLLILSSICLLIRPRLFFCGVDQSALGVVCEVLFMVFERDKCLSLCHFFNSITHSKFGCNVFELVVDVVLGLIICLSVGLCDILSQQLFVLVPRQFPEAMQLQK